MDQEGSRRGPNGWSIGSGSVRGAFVRERCSGVGQRIFVSRWKEVVSRSRAIPGAIGPSHGKELMPHIPGMLEASRLVNLAPVDLVIIIFYFLLVLAIGLYLKEQTSTGDDFFLAGREMTAWVAGLAFLSANLGSLELLGWAGSSYQYGILAAHWYWIGAIPAMVLLGIVMMPFYYISKTHSVPGYLQLRYGRAASGLSAISFAAMTVLMSGVNMYAMAVVMKVVL